MAICRVIYRIDFKPNFDIVDSAGRLMRLISSVSEKYWSELGESTQQHQINANYLSEDRTHHRHFSVSPNFLVAGLERTKGVAVNSLDKDESFTTLLDLVSKVVSTFQIQDVTRMGFRVFHFGSLGMGFEAMKEVFIKMVNTPYTNLASNQLGTIGDIGIAIDGRNSDKVQFHARVGPLDQTEADLKKFIQHIDVDRFIKSEKFDFICDIDLYDNDFSLAGIAPMKWCVQLMHRHHTFIAGLEEVLRKQAKG